MYVIFLNKEIVLETVQNFSIGLSRKTADPSFKYSTLVSMDRSLSKRVDLLVDIIKRNDYKE